MTNVELAKHALGKIKDDWFRLGVGASTGGKCDDGWSDTLDLDLSRPQLLYLLKEKTSHKDLFDGLELEKIDLESTIFKVTYEAAWPEGGPTAYVNDFIPFELEDIAERLESLDIDDSEAVAGMREQLQQVKSGEYTFYFTVEANGYYFAEDAEESVTLTDKEALGLLYCRYKFDKVFEGLCEEAYDEDLINEKAKEKGFADNYDNFGYSSECEELDAYLNAWDYILGSILSGIITEESLDGWLQYFEDSGNYELPIDEWYKNVKQ